MKTVILCGGSGTRLWPMSTAETPKQYLKIFNKSSLFEKTIDRNKNSEGFIIISNENHLKLVKELSPENSKFITEEIGRNTAPAIGFAALNSSPEDILLVLPSDHLIEELDKYNECISKAKELAQNGDLVTFGIKPTHPETGYGYIESEDGKVLSFKEKPDLDTAKSYIKKDNYLWNSGMFCFQAKTYLEELERYAPNMFQAIKNVYNNSSDDSDLLSLKKSDLLDVPSDSIDYAVMERSDKVKVVPANFKWNDLGSFDSLYDHLEHDESGNTKYSNLHTIDSFNNLIISTNEQKLIATFDIENLIIVNTDDELLIGKRGKSQKVKGLLKKIN